MASSRYLHYTYASGSRPSASVAAHAPDATCCGSFSRWHVMLPLGSPTTVIDVSFARSDKPTAKNFTCFTVLEMLLSKPRAQNALSIWFSTQRVTGKSKRIAAFIASAMPCSRRSRWSSWRTYRRGAYHTTTLPPTALTDLCL